MANVVRCPTCNGWKTPGTPCIHCRGLADVAAQRIRDLERQVASLTYTGELKAAQIEALRAQVKEVKKAGATTAPAHTTEGR